MNKMTEFQRNQILEEALVLAKRILLENELRQQVVYDLFEKNFIYVIRTGNMNDLVPPTEAEIEAELEKRVTALMSE